MTARAHNENPLAHVRNRGVRGDCGEFELLTAARTEHIAGRIHRFRNLVALAARVRIYRQISTSFDLRRVQRLPAFVRSSNVARSESRDDALNAAAEYPWCVASSNAHR
jgi:hypothetical protein